MAKGKDYEVGYGRPPKSSRFKSGKSGNPRGRPKGSLNFKTHLEKELQEKVRIREGDRELSVPKLRAVIKALMSKALKGDARAITVLIMQIVRCFENEPGQEPEQALSQSDLEILDSFIAGQMARVQKEK